MSWFSLKNYDLEKMRRYWKIYFSIESDSMLDNEELNELISKIRLILEKEIQNLMKKWISIPN